MWPFRKREKTAAERSAVVIFPLISGRWRVSNDSGWADFDTLEGAESVVEHMKQKPRYFDYELKEIT